ncbi:MAG: YabP/YqfC family sporulation protein [Clostridia bacterium]|nr:YabP/YqfC family sporulation protein [Clostridia bacterium]
MEENVNQNKEQTITLQNRKNLSVGGIVKVISVKNDLIQVDSNFGGIMISGQNLELKKLDNGSMRADIVGTIDAIKFLQARDKEPFFRRIVK